MTQLPILFLGENPASNTGLSRIGRHLASLLSSEPAFRVAFLGRNGAGGNGGRTSIHLPFHQYTFEPTSQSEWGEDVLVEVWKDFVGDINQPWVLFTIWDPSRVAWVGTPDLYASSLNPQYRELAHLLMSERTNLWGYFPIDAHGSRKDGALTEYLSTAVRGYDRVLAYSKFGQGVLAASGVVDVDWIPHGFKTNVFEPRDATDMAHRLGFSDLHCIVGCVMTNQERKDWGLWAGMARELRRFSPNYRFYCKTDSIDRYWDLRSLVHDYGLQDVTVIDAEDRTDGEMAQLYSMCDVTVLPSLGEGFGYPLVESHSCGVPCVTGSYGAAAEFLPTNDVIPTVEPETYRLDGRWGTVRPVYAPSEFAVAVHGLSRSVNRERLPGLLRASVAHLDWKVLWPSVWKKWFKAGLGEVEGLL